MAFVEYRGALEEINEISYWHLAPPDGEFSFFHHNLYCGKGFISSISYWIQHDPNLTSAATPYSLLNREKEKEAIFEKIRAESFPHLPSRLKAFFLLKEQSDIGRVMKEWFNNEYRTGYEAWILEHSRAHVGDATWLNNLDWEYAAKNY